MRNEGSLGGGGGGRKKERKVNQISWSCSESEKGKFLLPWLIGLQVFLRQLYRSTGHAPMITRPILQTAASLGYMHFTS